VYTISVRLWDADVDHSTGSIPKEQSMSFALGALISITLVAFAQDKDEPPAQISADVLLSWAENQFEIGYVKHGEVGQLQFLLQSEADAVPAFVHQSPSKATFKKLRVPERPFAVMIVPKEKAGATLGVEEARVLAGMKTLEMLVLSRTRLAKGGAKALAASGIKELYLVDSELTDDDVADLAGIKKLQKLSLNDNTKITSDSLKSIVKFRDLRWLSLGHTGIKELKPLADLAEIETLFLPGTTIAGSEFVHLAGLKKLRALHLSGSSVTEDTTKRIAELENLKVLSLNNTAISDTGLAHLTALKRLTRIELQKTKVTDDGVRALQKALPDLKVIR
jgi:hypothetical protein